MRNNIKVWALLFVFISAAAGCDKIETIKNQFSGKKEASAPAAAPESVQQNESIPAAPTVMPDNAVARIGKWTLTKEQFDERLTAIKEAVPAFDPSNAEAKQLILDELINQQLLVMDAEKSGLDKEKDVVSALEEFKRTVLIQEKARQLTQDIKVTEEEAKAFYDERKDSLVEPAQWHVREIVVGDEAKASDLLTQINNGGDFVQLAKDNSIGDTAANGGDLGNIVDVPFAEMANPLLGLEAGKVSSVFKGPKGFYIVKLEEKISGAPLVYEDIKDQIIANQTLVKQQQALLQYLQKLKGEYKVETQPELLK